MLTTSKPLFVYLQRPDTGEWVTVGRYLAQGDNKGTFRYAPSYVEAGLTWSIDPVNLPFLPDLEISAPRYGGLHDVLRDACPDAWGQSLLRREHGLPENTPMVRYLTLSSNAYRWGALAVGLGRKPSVSNLASPRLPQLEALVNELEAMSAHKPAVDESLRRRLVQTASAGGARPKATIQDEQGRLWLVKPRIATDIADIPRLEHFAQRWGAMSGLRFAESIFHSTTSGLSAIRVLRFDRNEGHRLMCLSAASLLQAEYPGIANLHSDRWSYPRLAEELLRIGVPEEDRIELFGRMVFNAVCGNDDDHLRNHAVLYSPEQKRWRLAPAFDVVPNPVETPRCLAMQLSTGRFDITRAAVLADAHRFGLHEEDSAAQHLDKLLIRIVSTFDEASHLLDSGYERHMHERMKHNVALLLTTK